MTASAHISVDRSRCASTGICESIASDVFEIGEDGALVVLQPDVPADLLEPARTAANSCPTRALTVD